MPETLSGVSDSFDRVPSGSTVDLELRSEHDHFNFATPTTSSPRSYVEDGRTNGPWGVGPWAGAPIRYLWTRSRFAELAGPLIEDPLGGTCRDMPTVKK